MSSTLTILVLGAEGCGKSLLIKRLQYLATNNLEAEFAEIPSTVPTVGNDIVKIKFNCKEYKLCEIGGAMAPIWKNYYRDADALIYIIDKSNQFQISASCIMLLTMMSNPAIKNKNVLILFSKTDFVCNFTFEQLQKIFRLQDLKESCDGSITLLECSNVDKYGYKEIIKWITNLT